MRFVPYYTVSYHGKFYRAGDELEIEDSDIELMEKHGKVVGVESSEMIKKTQAVNALAVPEKTARKPGGPRKQQ